MYCTSMKMWFDSCRENAHKTLRIVYDRPNYPRRRDDDSDIQPVRYLHSFFFFFFLFIVENQHPAALSQTQHGTKPNKELVWFRSLYRSEPSKVQPHELNFSSNSKEENTNLLLVLTFTIEVYTLGSFDLSDKDQRRGIYCVLIWKGWVGSAQWQSDYGPLMRNYTWRYTYVCMCMIPTTCTSLSFNKDLF